jgi:hypothetical protein
VTNVSDWEEKTAVHTNLVWLVRGFHDGEEEGALHGPQTLGHWKLVAFFRHPEFTGESQCDCEAFLQGVLQGIATQQKRQVALDASPTRGHPPS